MLKKRLISSPILSFPCGVGKFILDTDASNYDIGAVSSQIQDGSERVIVDSIKSFHHYLYGKKFLIRTDHVSLWLMLFKNLDKLFNRFSHKRLRSALYPFTQYHLTCKPIATTSFIAIDYYHVASSLCKIYWSYWDALVISDGVLCKR